MEFVSIMVILSVLFICTIGLPAYFTYKLQLKVIEKANKEQLDRISKGF